MQAATTPGVEPPVHCFENLFWVQSSVDFENGREDCVFVLALQMLMIVVVAQRWQ